MKTSVSIKLFLCGAALALGILGHTTAQAQIGGVPFVDESLPRAGERR